MCKGDHISGLSNSKQPTTKKKKGQLKFPAVGDWLHNLRYSSAIGYFTSIKIMMHLFIDKKKCL